MASLDELASTPVKFFWAHEHPQLFEEHLQQHAFLALDVEADSFYAYQTRPCLLQIAFTQGEVFLIDPLHAEQSISALNFLRNRTAAMHAADFDLKLLKNHGYYLPATIQDTQMAARLLGYRHYSLEALAQQCLGITLKKAYQKANWAQRPLKSEMIDYAVMDVYIVPALLELLTNELHRKKRLEWFTQSCHALLQSIEHHVWPQKHEESWRITGHGALRRNHLAILQKLWEWREEEAATRNIASFRILRNEEILWAAQEGQLGSILNRPHLSDMQKEVLQAIMQKALLIPAEKWPKKIFSHERSNFRKHDSPLFQKLNQRREKIAEQLDIEPQMLISKQNLIELVQQPEQVDHFLLPWQKELLL